MFIFGIFAVSLVLVYVVYLLKWKFKLIQLSVPSIADRKKIEKQLAPERVLRIKAFSEVKMTFNEYFFNDSDIPCKFSFIQVATSQNLLLLSSRAIDQPNIIQNLIAPKNSLDYLNFVLKKEEKYVFLDRLIVNNTSEKFVKHRSLIFSLYYGKVLKCFPKHNIVLMARSEPNERLLTKYLRLGFHVIGKKTHNDVLHYIILLEAKKQFSVLRASSLNYVLLSIKKRFYL